MRDWIAGIVGEDMATGAMLVVVTIAIVLAFVVLLAIFKSFSGTGIRQSRRTRQARLAVMDAAIVDSRRRLVLVRRDEVEHLVLIGGPTDVVVEQNIIRSGAPAQTKPAKHRKSNIQAAPAVPPSSEEIVPAARPAPVAPTAPAIAPTSAAPVKSEPETVSKINPLVSEAPKPVPSPQIRPVTRPPEPVASPPVPEAVVPPVAPTVPRDIPAPAPAPAVATAPPPVPTKPPLTVPPSTSRKPRVTPVLAQASASTAAAGVAGSTASSVGLAGSVSQAPPPASPVPVSAPEESQPVGSIADNQLSEFEDKLAMDLGETLVAEEPEEKSSLASEMDELLSEITSGTKR